MQENSYICPGQKKTLKCNKTFTEYDAFAKHILACRTCNDLKIFVCKHWFGHMYLNQIERDMHEENCVHRSNESLKIDCKNSENSIIINLLNKKPLLEGHYIIKKQEKIDIFPKLEKNTFDNNNNNLSQNYTDLHDLIIDADTQNLIYLFEFFEKYERGFIASNCGNYEIKFKKLEFKTFENVDSIPLFTENNFTESDYNDNLAFECEVYEQANEKEIYNFFNDGKSVGVNLDFGTSHNEVLMIAHKKTKHFKNYCKSDYAVFVWKYTLMYQTTIFSIPEIEGISSYWIKQVNFEGKENIDNTNEEKQKMINNEKDDINNEPELDELRKEIDNLKITIRKKQEENRLKKEKANEKIEKQRNRRDEIEKLLRKEERIKNEALQKKELKKKNKTEFENNFKSVYEEKLKEYVKQYEEIFVKRMKEVEQIDKTIANSIEIFQTHKTTYNKLKEEIKGIKAEIMKSQSKEDGIEKKINEIQRKQGKKKEAWVQNLCLCKNKSEWLFLPCQHLLYCDICWIKRREESVNQTEYCDYCQSEILDKKKIKWTNY